MYVFFILVFGMHNDNDIIINKEWSVINENHILISSIGSSGVFKCSIGHVADLVLERRVPVENLPRLRIKPDHEYVVSLVAEL